jgi:NADPH:quinone reductase-like Zn-dependent oxidoreductase
MRAVVNTEYGGSDVLRILDVERPVPADNEVLVEVHATTVNRTDSGFRAPSPWFIRLFAGLRRPKRTVLGTEFAGVVAEAGAAVTEFAVGDEVFGVNADRFGAHAEYLCVRESAPIAAKPIRWLTANDFSSTIGASRCTRFLLTTSPARRSSRCILGTP